MRKFLAFMMVLAMLLTLAACGAPTEPVATESSDTVTVGTVDEFLAALAPNRTIQLLPGNYCLSDASDYGKISENPYYSWRTGYKDYELNLHNLRNLTVIGSGMDQTFLETEAVGETVFELISCENVTLRGMAVGIGGSTAEYGYNYVLAMQGCNGIMLEKMQLFGCKNASFLANNCQDVTVTDSHIRDCDDGLAVLMNSRNVNIRNCEIDNIGSGEEMAYCVLEVDSCSDVVVDGCSISGYKVSSLIQNFGENGEDKNIRFKDTLFQNNEVDDIAFVVFGGTVTMENCRFANNKVACWSTPDFSGKVKDASGNVMADADFHKLNGSTADVPAEENAPAEEDTPWQEITVSNIDELLAALGPNRQIRLVPGTYDLCDASNYGQETDSRYYMWEDMFDGYGLVLNDVKGLTILGSGANQTFIETLPRSVAVLRLSNCSDIAIRDMTMGHVETAEYCEGPVLWVDDCFGIALEGLGLYGCGTEGVCAWHSQDLTVNNCHIYDCSVYGTSLFDCDNVSITNCTIERIGMGGMSVLSVDNCSGVIVDNCTVSECAVNELIECWTLRGDFAIKNTTFRNNYAYCAIVSYQGEKITLDNCTFAGNTVDFWYSAGAASCAVDATGAPITAADFMAMNG